MPPSSKFPTRFTESALTERIYSAMSMTLSEDLREDVTISRVFLQDMYTKKIWQTGTRPTILYFLTLREACATSMNTTLLVILPT